MAARAVSTDRTDDARTRILAAARALFTAQGATDVTVADIADAAGVSRATVFNQFGSKRGLVEAVTGGVFGAYAAILDAALLDRATPVPALIRGLFELMGRGIERDRAFYRTVFRHIAGITVGLEEGGLAEQERTRVLARLTQLLLRGQARGELIGTVDAEEIAVTLHSLTFGAITHWLYRDSREPLSERMLRVASLMLDPVATSRDSAYAGPPEALVAAALAAEEERS